MNLTREFGVQRSLHSPSTTIKVCFNGLLSPKRLKWPGAFEPRKRGGMLKNTHRKSDFKALLFYSDTKVRTWLLIEGSSEPSEGQYHKPASVCVQTTFSAICEVKKSESFLTSKGVLIKADFFSENHIFLFCSNGNNLAFLRALIPSFSAPLATFG